MFIASIDDHVSLLKIRDQAIDNGIADCTMWQGKDENLWLVEILAQILLASMLLQLFMGYASAIALLGKR